MSTALTRPAWTKRGVGVVGLGALLAFLLLYALLRSDGRSEDGASEDRMPSAGESPESARLSGAATDSGDQAQSDAINPAVQRGPESAHRGSSPLALAWAGRYKEAIPVYREKWQEADTPRNRSLYSDQLAVAILEGGEPGETAAYIGEWIAALCRETMTSEGAPNSDRKYSIWFECSHGNPLVELAGRLANAMSDMRVQDGGILSARRKMMLRLSEQQQRAATEIDAALIQATRDFLDLSSAYSPSIAGTADEVAVQLLPKVRSFIGDHANSREPSLATMAEWLQVRYRALLDAPASEKSGR